MNKSVHASFATTRRILTKRPPSGRGGEDARIPNETVLVRFHGTRVLLSLAAGDRLAACDLGHHDRAVLLCDPICAGLFCAKAARPPLSLDVFNVRYLHIRLRNHASDGSLDGLARHLPTGRCDQSRYGPGTCQTEQTGEIPDTVS